MTPCRDTKQNGARCAALGDDGTGADDRALPDMDTREDNGTRADPDVILNHDFLQDAFLLLDRQARIIKTMICADDSNVRPDQNVFTDPHGAVAVDESKVVYLGPVIYAYAAKTALNLGIGVNGNLPSDPDALSVLGPIHRCHGENLCLAFEVYSGRIFDVGPKMDTASKLAGCQDEFHTLDEFKHEGFITVICRFVNASH